MKINLNRIPITDKIKFFNQLYKDISGKGIGGDTELAHVNKYEACVLRALGGSGTINPSTNLTQYMGGGGGGQQQAPAPQSSTVKNVTELPEYFKPYAKEMLETSSELYDMPYEAYEGQRLADVSPAQGAAYTGMETAYSQTDPTTGVVSYKNPTEAGYTRAAEMSEAGSAQYGDLPAGEFEAKYMSPYQQAVTDVQTSEAQRKADIEGQQLAGEAGKAQAFGGSRHAVLEAERQRTLARQLSDIQATGGQQAFTAGQASFAADRAAQHAGAQQIATMTPSAQLGNLTGLGALQSLGETQRSISQQPLDINYEEFVREQDYPRKSVQEYGGIIKGFPMQPSTYTTSQQYQQSPTLGQNLLQAGALYGGIAGGLGKAFGSGGGYVSSYAGGGLAGLGFKTGTEVPEGFTLEQALHLLALDTDVSANKKAQEDKLRDMLGRGGASKEEIERILAQKHDPSSWFSKFRNMIGLPYTPDPETNLTDEQASLVFTIKNMNRNVKEKLNREWLELNEENQTGFVALGEDPNTWPTEWREKYLTQLRNQVEGLVDTPAGAHIKEVFPEEVLDQVSLATEDVPEGVKSRDQQVAESDVLTPADMQRVNAELDKENEIQDRFPTFTGPEYEDQDVTANEEWSRQRDLVRQNMDRMANNITSPPPPVSPVAQRQAQNMAVPTNRVPTNDPSFTGQMIANNPAHPFYTQRANGGYLPSYAKGGVSEGIYDILGGLSEGAKDQQAINKLFPKEEPMTPQEIMQLVAKHTGSTRGSISPYQEQLIADRMKDKSIKTELPKGNMERYGDILGEYFKYYPEDDTKTLSGGGLTGLRFAKGGAGKTINLGRSVPNPEYKPWWKTFFGQKGQGPGQGPGQGQGQGPTTGTTPKLTREQKRSANAAAKAALRDAKLAGLGGTKTVITPGAAATGYEAGQPLRSTWPFKRKGRIKDSKANVKIATQNEKLLRAAGYDRKSPEMIKAVADRKGAQELARKAITSRKGLLGWRAAGRIPGHLLRFIGMGNPVVGAAVMLGTAAYQLSKNEVEDVSADIENQIETVNTNEDILNRLNSPSVIQEEVSSIGQGNTQTRVGGREYAGGGLTGLRFKSTGLVSDSLIEEYEDSQTAWAERQRAEKDTAMREGLLKEYEGGIKPLEKKRKRLDTDREELAAEIDADEPGFLEKGVAGAADLINYLKDSSQWEPEDIETGIRYLVPDRLEKLAEGVVDAPDKKQFILDKLKGRRERAVGREDELRTIQEGKIAKQEQKALDIFNQKVAKWEGEKKKAAELREHLETLRGKEKEIAKALLEEEEQRLEDERPLFDMEAAAPWLAFASEVGSPGHGSAFQALGPAVTKFGEAKSAFADIATAEENALRIRALESGIGLSDAQTLEALSKPGIATNKALAELQTAAADRNVKKAGEILEYAAEVFSSLQDQNSPEALEIRQVAIKALTDLGLDPAIFGQMVAKNKLDYSDVTAVDEEEEDKGLFATGLSAIGLRRK